MQGQERDMANMPEQLLKNKEALGKLAQSGQAKRLVEMLDRSGGVRQAAQAAAAGRPEQLMDMMNRLMSTPEGAQLMESIGQQVKKAGLD